MTVEFLDEFEIQRLEELAAGEFPFNRWAKAILLLNWGASYAEAGNGSGLTARQARYRRDKFLRQRLDMFPGGAAGDWVPATERIIQGSTVIDPEVVAGTVFVGDESQSDYDEGEKKEKPKKKGKNKKSGESKKGKKKKKKKDKSKSSKKKK